MEIVAVPMNTFSATTDDSIETLTVCSPTLYPEPVFPIPIDWIVPAADTTAVPPAETKGWYPNPALDATETITPPLGNVEIPTSPDRVLAIPTNLALEIPEFSITS